VLFEGLEIALNGGAIYESDEVYLQFGTHGRVYLSLVNLKIHAGKCRIRRVVSNMGSVLYIGNLNSLI
jgi:hypothetical protein